MNDFQANLTFDAPASGVFAALATETGLRGWWTTTCDAGAAVGERITVRFGATYKVMRIERLVPAAEVAWRVIDARLEVPGLDRTREWIDTTISFRLVPEGAARSRLEMTHFGLTPEVECHDLCSRGWKEFLGSLKRYVETGAGTPYSEPSAIELDPR